jgi:hypothetical protein
MSDVSGTAVAATAAGAVLVWSGVKGTSLVATLRSLVSGKAPAGAEVNTLTGAGSTSGSLATTTAGASTYDQASLEALWQQAGGSAATAHNAGCHGMQESSGNSKVTSANPDGGTNVGLWQLDTKGVGAGYTVAQLQNPLTNARITVMATANGTDWSEWATPGC